MLERRRWVGFLTTLDTAILSMLGEHEVADDTIEGTLDEVLASSLWSRRLLHRNENRQQMLKAALIARVRFIWGRTTTGQRRGYFLAGVGLRTGEKLDAEAVNLNELLATANGAIIAHDADDAITAITAFAENIFLIEPFVPGDLPDNWRSILRAWLLGETIVNHSEGQEDEVLQFVEQALVYRLPWAMEAVRVRAIANGELLESGITMEDVELGIAVAAVETGTLNRSAAVLMHAGFSSRLAAISAVIETGAHFTTMSGLRRWLRSNNVASRLDTPEWPTEQSHGLWLQFVESLAPARRRTWLKRKHRLEVRWDEVYPDSRMPVRLLNKDGKTLVLNADFTRLGSLASPVNAKRLGLALASVAEDEDYINVEYLGPGDLLQS